MPSFWVIGGWLAVSIGLPIGWSERLEFDGDIGVPICCDIDSGWGCTGACSCITLADEEDDDGGGVIGVKTFALGCTLLMVVPLLNTGLTCGLSSSAPGGITGNCAFDRLFGVPT